MRRLVIILVAVWTLAVPIGLATTLFVERAQAADPQCRDTSRPIVALGLRRNCGYFFNNYDTSGDYVRFGGVPSSVNTAAEFIALVEGDLNSGNAQRVTSAQFIILTMIDRAAGMPKSVTPDQLKDWKERVNSYASASENGSRSSGPNGHIDWFVSLHIACGTVNTYYQDDENDVGVFTDTTNNSRCGDSSYFTNFIIFRDTSGNPKYMIRRECMNPVGNLENGIDKPKALNYNLNPSIGVEVNGDSAATTAELGDSVKFTYQAVKSGDDPATNINCTINANVRSGFFATPATPTSGNNPAGYSPPATGCPKTFTPGLNTITTETITVTTANQTVCRSLFVSPASSTVSSRGYEACVPIVNKPYARVFGGDVVAGASMVDTLGGCVSNDNAAIVGWSKRNLGSFAGAGTQYGSFAMKGIRDFASALGSPASANAQAPSGLSFTNATTNPNAGDYGGNFDDLPCSRDYYADKPAAPASVPATFNTMTTGAYGGSGNVTLRSGVVDVNERISVYVDGDVFIDGNITLAPGTWNLSQLPTFKLVVKGNIYVNRSVTQLDGMYVAQKTDSGSGGGFYTCATGFSALPLNGSLNATCNTKLTVNGGVLANAIYLMRTRGSLAQSSANETSATSQAAEVFNFSPGLWLRQPPVPGSTPDYDAIISLPPIL